MSNPQTYVTRPVEPVTVEAMRWDGTDESAEAIGLWANGEGFDWDDDNLAVIWDDGLKMMFVESPPFAEINGCGWIVRNPDGTWTALSDADFDATYEPA